MVFNQYMARSAAGIEDVGVRRLLGSGEAFSLAMQSFVNAYPEPLRSQIQAAFDYGFNKVMLVSVGFAGLALLLSLCEEDIKLRTDLETEFGLEDRRSSRDGANVEALAS